MEVVAVYMYDYKKISCHCSCIIENEMIVLSTTTANKQRRKEIEVIYRWLHNCLACKVASIGLTVENVNAGHIR